MPEILQFGPFRLVVPEGDLFKGTTRIRLQQHPLTLLLILLERPGDLVTREEIRSRVWPNGTIVEFDHGINAAMHKLRAALSDRAEKPRYIETVARKGYRFLAAVHRTTAAPKLPDERRVNREGLSPGRVVTHYRIESLIGSGANGQVFEAVDLNLERRVALKFLMEGQAADHDAHERFHREARVISALDHPNICSVFEFGEHAGTRFLAMQFLDGETLAERIRTKGPLSLDCLLEISMQAAAGIEAAHARGVIHRDIKPANIFLTRSGQVKLLDFGLAKSSEACDTGPRPAHARTEGTSVWTTLAGAVMGTIAYMSPEQIRGEGVDHRTDIFSFGLVLYEMAAGRHPFAGAAESELSGLLLHEPVPSLPDDGEHLPPALTALINGMVEKDRDRRVSSFTEVRNSLEKLQGVRHAQHGTPPPRGRLKYVAAALAMIVAAAALTLALRRAPDALNLTVTPLTSSPGLKEHVVLSPDDSHIAFAWYGEGDNEDIYVQKLRSHTPIRLTSNAARDFSPAWSPDGMLVAFVRSDPDAAAVFVVPSSGGPERKITDFKANPVPFCRALDWSPDGRFLALIEWRPRSEGGPTLSLVSAINGTSVRRLLTTSGEFLCAPAFSPDGAMIAVISGPDFRVSDVYVVPVEGGTERRVTFDSRMIQGIAWTSDSAGVAYSLRRTGPFGLWQVAASGGQPRTLLETGNDVVDPHLSRKNNRLVFVRDMWDTNLWRVEGPEWTGPRSGPAIAVSSTREESGVDVSPDGQMLVFTSGRTGAFELWTARIDGSSPRQLTNFGGPETGYARWSPDGKQIVFNSYPEGHPEVFVTAVEQRRPRRITNGEMPFWSEDGRWIYFLRTEAAGRALWRISAAGGDASQVGEVDAAMLLPSRDERYYLYERNGSLWIRTRDNDIAKRLVDGITHGLWAPAKSGACYLSYATPAFTLRCVSSSRSSASWAAEIGSWPRVYGPPAFAISPDGKWVFYGRTDQLESNIMLAEGVGSP
jgi:serine/threonine protein kinase